LTISVCYSWETVGIDALFNNMYDWKGVWGKVGEVNSTKAYTINY
jgi:hypothetical protein